MATTRPNSVDETNNIPHAARNLFRKNPLSIGRRLTVCFLLIVGSMLAADAVEFWNFKQMVAPTRRLSNADRAALALVRLRLDVDTFVKNVAVKENNPDMKEFSTAATELRESFLRNVEDAQQALSKAPEISREDPSIAVALETLKVTLPSQLDTAVQLAATGDWNAVRLRLEHQIGDLIDLSSSLVEKMGRQAQQQRTKAIEDTATAQKRLVAGVFITGLLTFVLAVALGWYATQSITVPLSELASGAQALARGDLSHRVSVYGNDELAVVARAFNHAARKLQELYEELREQASLLNLTHDAIYVRDMKGVIRYWNHGAEELYGWPAEYAVGHLSRELLKPVSSLAFAQIEAELLRTGRWQGELLKTRKDGTQLVVASRWSLKRDDRGEPVAILVTSNDISERRRAEENARRSENELRDVIEAVPAMVWRTLPDGSLDFINHRWQEFTGLSLDNALGWNWEATVHPDDRDRFVAEWRAALSAGQPMQSELRVRAANGEYRWLFVRNVPLRNEMGKIVKWYGMGFEIDARKKAEEALRRSEAYLAEAQRLSHTGSFAFDVASNKYVYISEEFLRTFELDAQQNLPLGEAVSRFIHAEDRAKVKEATDRAFGEKIDYDVEYRIVLPHRSVKHIHAIGHPILDQAGQLVEYVGTVIDITERKRAEQEREMLQQLQAQLAHMDRISILGELAASIAHEVNQPLAGIVSSGGACLRWLAADPPNLEEVRESIRRIVGAGKHAGEVIARIRALTKRAAAPEEKLNLNETIREVLVLVGDEAKRNKVTVRTVFADGLSPVFGDRVQLQQVLLNLIINAIEAMSSVSVSERSRELVITTRNTDAEQVQVTVEDSGTGIDANAIQKIFDPFYTTKSTGMGMGLSISRSILQHHGGRLWATAKASPGAIFHFALPKYHEEESNAGAATV
jgi:PAS domain S-box-containing protein